MNCLIVFGSNPVKMVLDIWYGISATPLTTSIESPILVVTLLSSIIENWILPAEIGIL